MTVASRGDSIAGFALFRSKHHEHKGTHTRRRIEARQRPERCQCRCVLLVCPCGRTLALGPADQGTYCYACGEEYVKAADNKQVIGL